MSERKPRLTDVNSWLVVWRYTREARAVGRPARTHRRYRTEDEARQVARTRLTDREVKSVWLWGPAPLRENGRPGPRPGLDPLEGLVRLTVRIENTYEDGDTVVTEVTEVVEAPPEGDRDDWAQDELFPLTGTGRTKGDSWYDLEITACSDPSLVGLTFDFGY